MARLEQKEPSNYQDVLEEDDAYYSILTDVVFKGQFTLEQLYEGASQEYISKKMQEAIHGIKPNE